MSRLAPELSFEYFPPRSPLVAERLSRTARALAARGPTFCSVTYGAGGSSRDLTLDTVTTLARETGGEVAPHITAIGTPVAELERLLERYAGCGIRRVVAIRGDRADVAGGQPAGPVGEGLAFGTELVRLIRDRHRGHFRIYVGAYPECHPESASFQADLARFEEKVEAGADAAITQFFYSAEAYLRFIEEARARGIAIPIIPGVMPIHDFAQIARFAARCGAEIPRWFATRMAGYGDEESRRAYAADVVAALCRRLLELEAPGFHFYTLNRAEPTEAVLARLDRAGL